MEMCTSVLRAAVEAVAVKVMETFCPAEPEAGLTLSQVAFESGTEAVQDSSALTEMERLAPSSAARVT